MYHLKSYYKNVPLALSINQTELGGNPRSLVALSPGWTLPSIMRATTALDFTKTLLVLLFVVYNLAKQSQTL